MSLKSLSIGLGLSAAVVGLSGCASTPAPSEQETVAVTVQASYRERIALTPGHKLTVSVEDVSLVDAPSVTLAKQTVALDRGVPVTLTLQVPADQIKANHTYAARADIRDSEGRLRFVNDTHTPVLTRGAGNSVSIIMVSAR